MTKFCHGSVILVTPPPLVLLGIGILGLIGYGWRRIK